MEVKKSVKAPKLASSPVKRQASTDSTEKLESEAASITKKEETKTTSPAEPVKSTKVP